MLNIYPWIKETTPPCQPRIAGGQGLELHCLKLCLFTHIVQILRGYSERAFVEVLIQPITRRYYANYDVNNITIQ